MRGAIEPDTAAVLALVHIQRADPGWRQRHAAARTMALCRFCLRREPGAVDPVAAALRFLPAVLLECREEAVLIGLLPAPQGVAKTILVIHRMLRLDSRILDRSSMAVVLSRR